MALHAVASTEPFNCNMHCSFLLNLATCTLCPFSPSPSLSLTLFLALSPLFATFRLPSSCTNAEADRCFHRAVEKVPCGGAVRLQQIGISRQAVNFLGDADTVGAIAGCGRDNSKVLTLSKAAELLTGQLAGAFYGLAGIDQRAFPSLKAWIRIEQTFLLCSRICRCFAKLGRCLS